MPLIYFLIFDLFNEPRYPMSTSTNKYILLCFFFILLSIFFALVRPDDGSFVHSAPRLDFISFQFYFAFSPSFCITIGCILQHQNLDGVQRSPIGFFGS